MKYLFATEDKNYEDYSSGRVLYGAPNATNFPVRLTTEVFQRCTNFLKSNGNTGPYKIYDPFCGAGYSLTVLGFLHGEEIKFLYGSDSNKEILDFAKKNLSLLTPPGMKSRINELKGFIEKYNKDSHRDAVDSAYTLQSQIYSPESKIFEYNVLSGIPFPEDISNIDIIITDLPYGKLTSWDREKSEQNPVQIFLDKIKERLNPVSVIALIYNKEQVISYQGFSVVSKFKLGKRNVMLLKK